MLLRLTILDLGNLKSIRFDNVKVIKTIWGGGGGGGCAVVSGVKEGKQQPWYLFL